MRRLIRGVLGAVLVVLAVSGCSEEHYDERGKADAPVAGRAGEDSPAEVYNFPDGFGNVATKCVGDGRRGYATTKSVRQEGEDDVVVLPAHAVIVDDPECRTP
ncbi:hypothetical protein [Streptomyces sp. NPDC003401]